MPKTVVIIGALDTKGQDFTLVKELIEGTGLNTLVVDFGVMGEPEFEPEVKRAEVAAAADGDLAHLASLIPNSARFSQGVSCVWREESRVR